MVDGAVGHGGQRSPTRATGDRGPAGPREAACREPRSELVSVQGRARDSISDIDGCAAQPRRLRGARPPCAGLATVSAHRTALQCQRAGSLIRMGGGPLEIETLERALHMWPPWQKTIDEARATLGYKPDFSSEEMDQWIRGYGLRSDDRVKEMAQAALQLLDLPDSFAWYWTACFYSRCRRPDGSIDYEAIRLGAQRIWPPNPLRLRLFEAAGRWKRFQVDGPLNLVTKTQIDEWASTLGQLAERHRHPLMTLIPRARATTNPRKQEAQHRWLEGSATFTDVLREEYWFTEGQEGLELERTGKRGNEAVKAEQCFRRKVYNRVRQWWVEAGLRPARPDPGWWKNPPGTS